MMYRRTNALMRMKILWTMSAMKVCGGGFTLKRRLSWFGISMLNAMGRNAAESCATVCHPCGWNTDPDLLLRIP